jgi:hypothetical protein
LGQKVTAGKKKSLTMWHIGTINDFHKIICETMLKISLAGILKRLWEHKYARWHYVGHRWYNMYYIQNFMVKECVATYLE